MSHFDPTEKIIICK